MVEKKIDQVKSKTFNTRDLKKLLKNCENKLTVYENKKSKLENEMLLENFYDGNNQKRIQEVSSELKTLKDLITEEEKKWEELAVQIENCK